MGIVQQHVSAIKAQVAKAIVGQEQVIDLALAAMLSNGHVLLEGVPGVAKTLLVRSLCQAMSLGFGRVQLTPDLMPSDLLGTSIFNPKTLDFELRKGPIFVSVLLADEINRTPPKTQAGLLEAMEERHVTIDRTTHPLPEPFVVFATQNPIEFEGTYPLPEAQLDRFLMKIVVDYPSPDAEIHVLLRHHRGFTPRRLEDCGIQAVVGLEELNAMRTEIQSVAVEEKFFNYIYAILSATRQSNDVMVGASPRAGIAILNCSKAVAAMQGRDFLTPDDVKLVAIPVLRHRIILRPEAEIEGLQVDKVVAALVESQPVPR